MLDEDDALVLEGCPSPFYMCSVTSVVLPLIILLFYYNEHDLASFSTGWFNSASRDVGAYVNLAYNWLIK